MSQLVVSFAGAGKVATALCLAMHDAGHRIGMMVSGSEEHGRRLAGTFGATWSNRLSFAKPADVIIVAVPDHKLSDVLRELESPPGTLVVHTAGSFGAEVFPPAISRKGVFYPLQTFSAGRKISMKGVPVFLESSDSDADNLLRELALSIGASVHYTDTGRRRILHAAAVFACNFTNHMLTAGKIVAGEAGFPFSILQPLITETLSKAMENGPETSQTGPAIRHDLNTMEKHLELLSFSPELRKLYADISESIMKYYNKDL